MKIHSLVFVYGTLRRDELNHHLLKGARYLGQHTTGALYKMVSLGTYPGVVTGGRTRIQGEVYEIDAETLSRLDRLEGYPTAYSRELMPTPWGRAWIYIYRGSLQDRETIVSGVWYEKIARRRWSR